MVKSRLALTISHAIEMPRSYCASHIHRSQYPKVILLYILLITMRSSASVVSLIFFAVNTFALHQVTWKIMVQMFMGILPSLMVLFDALPNALDVMLDI